MLLGLLLVASPFAGAAEGEWWLTDPGRSVLFQKQTTSVAFGATTNAHPSILIDDTQTYQTMDGFGFTLTGGSALHIVRMQPAARAALLRELFATDSTNIGTSYLRLTLGASDLNARVFSYNDLPPGETDPELKEFDLGPDRDDVIPVLREILAINPAYYIIAHAAKFVRPRSVRLASNMLPDLPNVAFKTPDGKYVAIVLNDSRVPRTFYLAHHGRAATSTLDGNAVGTYVW